MIDIKKVADEADMIISGYAFTYTNNNRWIKVINLNSPQRATVITTDAELVETTMDDIEIEIVKKYWRENREFMEDENAEIL